MSAALAYPPHVATASADEGVPPPGKGACGQRRERHHDGVDHIRFDRQRMTLGDHRSTNVVDVTVNRQRLVELLATVPGGDRSMPVPLDDVLAPGRRLWLGEAPVDPELAEHGRVAVTTCSCGNFGCGGFTARITFQSGLVRWSEFTRVFHDEPVDLGPFQFRRSDYTRNLTALATP